LDRWNSNHNIRTVLDVEERKQDPLDKLAKLTDRKQKGVIVEEEFQKLKTDLLKKL